MSLRQNLAGQLFRLLSMLALLAFRGLALSGVVNFDTSKKASQGIFTVTLVHMSFVSRQVPFYVDFVGAQSDGFVVVMLTTTSPYLYEHPRPAD
ncbi:hypothetical protein GQ53DRAFT_175906 [Thozetella sp. PMI_491]|nr:hypothetical protein GQ53DRAFT_175906 [Thozetella sp. PMI_491]